MDVINYAQNQIQNKRLLVTILACMVLTTVLTVYRFPAIVSLLLAVQIVLFFLVFYRPVWAIAALLIGQLTISNYIFYISGAQVSIRFIWTVFAFLVMISILGKEGKLSLGNRAGRIYIPAICLFAFAIIANLVNTDVPYTIEYIRQVATAIIILILLPAVVKDKQDLKILVMVAFFTCLASAVLALLQHYNFRFFPVANTIFGVDFVGRRVIGFNDSPVDLSFTLPMIIIPAISLLLLKGVKPGHRLPLLLSILIMTAALYFTFTRSGIYALGAGVIAMGFFIKIKIKKEILLALLVVCVSFLIYADIKGNRYSKGFAEEDSAAGRLVLWQAGANIALDYPLLGIGNRGFKEMSLAYMDVVDFDTEVVEATDVLGVEQPHNDFIRVWISYGTPALIAFLWLLLVIFSNFYASYRRSSTPLIKGVSLGCFAAMVAYIISAATHNVMDSVWFVWILAGLSIATCKLADKEKRNPTQVST